MNFLHVSSVNTHLEPVGATSFKTAIDIFNSTWDNIASGLGIIKKFSEFKASVLNMIL